MRASLAPRPFALAVLVIAVAGMAALGEAAAQTKGVAPEVRRFEAETSDPVPQRDVQIGEWTWRCDRRRCTASGPGTRLTPVACAQVSAALGPLVRFSHDRGRLDVAQLAECNRLGARVLPNDAVAGSPAAPAPVPPAPVPVATPLVVEPAQPVSAVEPRGAVRRVITAPLIFHGQGPE